MPERPLDATLLAPLREGAATLQAVAARVAALTMGVDQHIGTLAGRLAALPPSAQFDPFAVLPTASNATAADGAEATPATRRSASQKHQARASALGTAGVAASGTVQRTAGSSSSQSGAPGASGHRPAHTAEPVAQTRQQALGNAAQTGSDKTPSIGQIAQAVASLPVALDQALAGMALRQPAETLIAQFLETISSSQEAGRPTAPGSASRSSQAPSPAVERLQQILTDIAAAGAAAGAATGGGASAGSLPPVGARTGQALQSAGNAATAAAATASRLQPSAAATPAARRAPSLLLGGATAVIGPSTAPAAAAGVAETPRAAPSASPPSPAPDTDDVIADINRLLVDQAWQRGVDLR